MNRSNKIFSIVAVVAGVVVIGLAIGWFASSKSKPDESRAIGTNLLAASQPQTTEPVTARRGPNPSPTAVPPKPHPQLRSRETNAQGQVKTAANSATTAPAATNGIPDWEDRVENILVADTEDHDKVKKMADMFPQLAADGQEEVAHHLSNLTADEDYGAITPFLTNSSLTSDVLDVFYEDLLNRPNGVKLPLLLQIAENPQHPNAQDAHDVLELFLEEDYGTDWPKWQTAMQQWLKDNPD